MTEAPSASASLTDSLSAQLEERLIHQEYKIWKKNTPYLYDLVMTHGLEWPSLTIQWLPTFKTLNDGNKVAAVGGTSRSVAEQHEFLLGTHTTGEQNYLMVGSVNLPRDDVVTRTAQPGGGKRESGANKKQKTQADVESDVTDETTTMATATTITATNYDQEKNELGGYSSSTAGLVGKIEIRMKIPHEGEVNRARYMPQNHFVVATRGPSSEVFIWDLSKHISFPEEGASPSPQVICRGHTGEGYGLAWCGISGKEHEGLLATCSEDKTVLLWNVREGLKEGKNGTVIHPITTFQYHTDVVEDVDWHKLDPNLIASCGDDRRICLWDIREGKNTKPFSIIEKAHEMDVNSLEFHPTNEFLIASCGSDKMVNIWDMRNLKCPLHTLTGHHNQVYSVHWSPIDTTILASCSADRRIILWDLSRIGDEQSPEDAEDGPPELLFIHGGHTSKVSDFSWNANYEGCLASVSEDNVLQVWSPVEDVFLNGSDDEDDDEGEDLAIKHRTEILRDDELE